MVPGSGVRPSCGCGLNYKTVCDPRAIYILLFSFQTGRLHLLAYCHPYPSLCPALGSKGVAVMSPGLVAVSPGGLTQPDLGSTFSHSTEAGAEDPEVKGWV